MIGEGNVLAENWKYLDESTRDVLELAYRIGRENGRNRIRTRYLFAALNTARPGNLEDVLQHVPEEVMPEPVDTATDGSEKLPEANPELSPCVRGSISALGSLAEEEGIIRPLDLFVDLAIHGGGSTVSNMRSHGVTANRVRQILQREDLQVTERDS